MMRCLIVDDEPVARRRIKRLLKTKPTSPWSASRATVELRSRPSGRCSRISCSSTCRCPRRTDSTVVRALGDAMPMVVFVTAFDQYALGAFEVHALDYLLKPFNRTRFLRTVSRAREHLARGRGTDVPLMGLLGELQAGKRRLTRFVVRAAGRLLIVEAGQVDWIEAADNYAVLHVGAATHPVRETMADLAGELDPERFVRIHRSTIVQIDRVRELLPAFHGDFVAVLRDGTRLDMSRSHRSDVEAVLGRSL